ncbi:hypothetical protein DFQ28_000423 [Apophysomyces sp. BC1034]|nr:hypothetical protein DFQ28_000423 [Apophysomyces sp. BC1034]
MDQDEALSILNDFNEILQSEVHVDLERLRLLARHGIPSHIRGEAWKYLLGIQEADRSKELTSSKARSEEYEQIDKHDPEISKRIRGEVSRYLRRTPELQGNNYPEQLESMSDEYYTNSTIKERVASFMTLFRYVHPELCNYFEDEEVDLNEWATSWLQHLLAKEMKFENLVRLWDTYFAIPDLLDFHPFVCLAILRIARENLEDLEQSEIRTMLLRLPNMDMRGVIAEAYNIRHETMERQMFEDEHL